MEVVLIMVVVAGVVLAGSRASAKKTKGTGFEFRYPSLEEALQEIYPRG